jgi:hypothetical protein
MSSQIDHAVKQKSGESAKDHSSNLFGFSLPRHATCREVFTIIEKKVILIIIVIGSCFLKSFFGPGDNVFPGKNWREWFVLDHFNFRFKRKLTEARESNPALALVDETG